MSHLDELDEFEAKLELELKREYTAVFGLFRYCILTQDATYLCNRLDLKVAPQASYPFFHLQMEDVWVWDKNRPTRMIPRAEVYTSGDLTVEELRGEGDEPKLTAQALAERIGEPLPDDGDMLLLEARPTARARHASPLQSADAARCRCRQHPDRPRPLRRRPADGGLARRHGAHADGRRARRAARRHARPRRRRRHLPRLDRADADSRVGAPRPPLGGGADPRRRPRRQDRHPDSLRRPTRGRPRPHRQLGRRQGALRRPRDRRRLRHLDELRRRLPGGRLRRRRARAGHRDVDGGALRPRRPARQGRLRRAAERDREDDGRRPPVRRRLRLRRPGRRHRRPRSAASSASRRRSSPRAACRSSSRRTRGRSRSSTRT